MIRLCKTWARSGARSTCAVVPARGWVLFIALAVLWGIPYLFIKVAVDDPMLGKVSLRRCGRVGGAALLAAGFFAAGGFASSSSAGFSEPFSAASPVSI